MIYRDCFDQDCLTILNNIQNAIMYQDLIFHHKFGYICHINFPSKVKFSVRIYFSRGLYLEYRKMSLMKEFSNASQLKKGQKYIFKT
jgi:hypothetical protein